MAAGALLGASFPRPGIRVARPVKLGLEVQPVLSSRGAGPWEEESSGAVEGAIEVSGLEGARQRECAGCLKERGHPPALFLLEACRSFPVVVVGEKHWERESLEFLRDMLPELHQSGVRCLAMEWLLAKDDELLDRLVTLETYDAELALEIARHHSWRTWGWKGYVDVLESVWRVNATWDRQEAKLRVVGLDLRSTFLPWRWRCSAIRMIGPGELPGGERRQRTRGAPHGAAWECAIGMECDVTDSMLAENQPFYTAMGASTGIEVRDAPSADLALSRQ